MKQPTFLTYEAANRECETPSRAAVATLIELNKLAIWTYMIHEQLKIKTKKTTPQKTKRRKTRR